MNEILHFRCPECGETTLKSTGKPGYKDIGKVFCSVCHRQFTEVEIKMQVVKLAGKLASLAGTIKKR